MGELKALFRPEFLNRVDDIIVFHKLTKEDTQKIARKMLATLEKKLRDMDIQMEFTDAAVEAVADRHDDPRTRRLSPVIQNQVEDPSPRRCWKAPSPPTRPTAAATPKGSSPSSLRKPPRLPLNNP